MPLAPYTTTQIEIPVTDRVFNDTTIKQKAVFTTLTHTQNEKSSKAVIEVLVSMYANDNGDYGQKLSGQGFSPYFSKLGADNDTIVNAQTGEILLVRTDESDALWQARADMHPDTVMFQADFFLMLRDTQTIEIGNLIKQHITQADALGRFR